MSHIAPVIDTNYNNYLPNDSGGCWGEYPIQWRLWSVGQSYDIASVSCGQTSRGAGGVVMNYTERGDAASIYILSIIHTLCR